MQALLHWNYHGVLHHVDATEHFVNICNYVIFHHPYFNRSAGLDHFMAFAHDTLSHITEKLVGLENRLPANIFKHVIYINNNGDISWPGFNMAKDISMSFCLYYVYVSTIVLCFCSLYSYSVKRIPWRRRKYLFVFVGTLELFHEGYSGCVRKHLGKEFVHDTDFVWRSGIHGTIVA